MLRPATAQPCATAQQQCYSSATIQNPMLRPALLIHVLQLSNHPKSKIDLMPFINFNNIPHSRIWDGIHGALHHSDSLTFGHITVEAGAILPEHHHIHEQWTHVLDGQLEFTLGGETHLLTSGITAHVPSDVPHSARALTQVKLIDCFMPVREDFKSLEPWTS